MKQKLYCDRQTRTLSDLQPGENVRVQRGATWQPAVILHKHEQPHSFVIRTPDGREYRRNRKYLWKTDKKNFPSTTEPDIYLNKDTGMRDYDTRDNQTTHIRSPEYTVAEKQETPEGHPETFSYKTRSGRQVKLPVRYRE